MGLEKKLVNLDVLKLAFDELKTPGIIAVDIDEHGHLIYTRTAAADADFYLEDGHLIMEVET